MSSTASVSATPTQHLFQRRVEEVRPSKADINYVVMDYLVSEGYRSAAERFAKEADLDYPITEESMQARVEIRSAIHAGDIETAITKINDLNPEILETDRALHFALLRLQLIEIIRKNATSPNPQARSVINFATSQLAPRAATNPDFLKELEQAMSLFIWLPDHSGLTPELQELLKPSLRRDLANRVNKAILESLGASGNSRLRDLVRLRIWAEATARKEGKDLPPTIPLGLQDAESLGREGNRVRDPDAMVS